MVKRARQRCRKSHSSSSFRGDALFFAFRRRQLQKNQVRAIRVEQARDFVWAPVRIQGLVDTNIPELTATPADRLGERWCDSEYQCINLLIFPIAACAVSAATSIRGLLMSSTGSRSVGAFRYLIRQAECHSVAAGIRLKSNGRSAEKERGEPGSAPNNPMRGSSRISGSQGLSAGQMLTTGQGD